MYLLNSNIVTFLNCSYFWGEQQLNKTLFINKMLTSWNEYKQDLKKENPLFF